MCLAVYFHTHTQLLFIYCNPQQSFLPLVNCTALIPLLIFCSVATGVKQASKSFAVFDENVVPEKLPERPNTRCVHSLHLFN